MSQHDMLKAAEAEVRRLEEELAKSELGQKLALARQVVAIYRPAPEAELELRAISGLRGEFTNVPLQTSVLVRSAEQLKGIIEGTRTKGAQIEKICADHLRAKHGRATSGELAEVVTKCGIHLSGVTPSKSLAALLSHSKLFDNDRAKGGYGLVEWSERHDEEQKTATSQ